MDAKHLITLKKILSFTAIIEILTGLAALICPALVITLLLGSGMPSEALMVGRCFGIAILALGLACWPDARPDYTRSFFAMLVYNVLIALYLIYLGAIAHVAGVLLWPAVALHTLIALILIRLRLL